MTDAIATPQAPASGVDLARQSLAAARASARQRGERPSGSRKAHRAHTARQPDGREPIGFSALLTNLVTDRAWELPSADGSLVDEWPAVVTDLTGHVALVGYDPDTGELAVRPSSSPYATAVRLRTLQLINAANKVMGNATAVRTIRILPPGTTPALPHPASALQVARAPVPAGRVPSAPAKKPEGYREAIAQHRAHRYTQPLDTQIAKVQREQIRTRILEPEDAFAEGWAEAERLREQAEREQTRSSAEARALARARAEKAGLSHFPPQATASAHELLDRTA
ncbi:DUF721 domain-containing protein [Streptomyces sp. NBC_01565]|uniref:DUF721 domain-containing protein n=1 Tax=unclassified Streptomyces TaxID=2593676 RepID=UPI002252FF36|nr:DUF721 domain-containing protein [Streptomyces sp. NBC_01565]MCX4546503.1 DUF721 domain-containing protein [Streptomyces sp. NBC_01565]